MDFPTQLFETIKAHWIVLLTGSLGATFGFLLSKEPMKDRVIGWIAGMILCMVFSEPASHFLANDAYPELFAFVLGTIGKQSAETLLELFRNKVVSTVKTKTGQDKGENDDKDN